MVETLTPSLELYIPFNCCKCKGGSRPAGARGSPLFLDQTEARRAEINFFGDHSHDNPPPPPPIPLSHGLDPPLKCTKPKRFLNYFTFYKPKWKISLSFHILQGMKFLLFHITWSLKQIPLSGGASPHRSLKGVAPGWSLLLLLFHVALFVFPKNLTLASHIF